MSSAETTIWARLRGEAFLATIKAKDVPAILDFMDEFTKERDLTEQSNMQDAVEILESGKRGKDALRYVTHCLLWAACRCPAGKAAEKAARKGGKNVGFDIAYNPDGSFIYGLHVLDGPAPDIRRLPDVRAAARVPKGAVIN